MKVVINKDYGGFNLSEKVGILLRKKGMKILDRLPKENEVYDGYIRQFLGQTKCTYLKNYWNNEVRSNPILIEAIEQLGLEESSGPGSELSIVDIPFDGVDGWEIEEYAGNEWISECHSTWR